MSFSEAFIVSSLLVIIFAEIFVKNLQIGEHIFCNISIILREFNIDVKFFHKNCTNMKKGFKNINIKVHSCVLALNLLVLVDFLTYSLKQLDHAIRIFDINFKSKASFISKTKAQLKLLK
ncbi:MAG: hypothetical protein AAGE84_30040 [Cyanobacteria bacterium P01_G01_bin.39]